MSYDVAIIGYGPVGVTAANLLGSLGRRVLVVERDSDVYSRARAISTDEEVLRIWQRIGLADDLTANMLADKPLTFVDARGATFLSFVPETFGNGHPPQLFIHQPSLERTLRAGAARHQQVEVRLGHECTALTQDADGVDLAVLDRAGGIASTVRADYVIAADGGSSPTRTRLGVGFAGRTYEDRWVVIDTRVIAPWPEIDRLRFHCNPARPAVDCPTPLGHHRWEFPVLPGDDEAALTSPAGVWDLLAEHGIGRDQVEVLRAVLYSHHVRFADRWRVGRVFLAGDAAHVMPPWIGQGMASGVRDVDNLCWKLHAALDPRTTNDDTEVLLGSYEIERMPHVRAITRAAVFFGHVITERRPAVTAARDAAFRLACRLPSLGAYLQSARWFPRTSYRSGVLAHRRTRRSPGSAVGHHLPQPWVLDEHGSRTRLDDALGNLGWTVLHTGSAARRADLAAWTRAGIPAVQVRPAGSDPIPAAVVDVDNRLIDWMRRHGATVLATRPDSIVYAAASRRTTLAPPPGAAQAAGRVIAGRGA